MHKVVSESLPLISDDCSGSQQQLSLSLTDSSRSMAAVETRECETEGCCSEAKLQCPTCIKLGIQGSYFCSQVKL